MSASQREKKGLGGRKYTSAKALEIWGLSPDRKPLEVGSATLFFLIPHHSYPAPLWFLPIGKCKQKL